MKNTLSNTDKAKKILDDYFRSGIVKKLSKIDKNAIYKQLDELWSIIDDSRIIINSSEREVQALLGMPTEKIDTIWFYPSTFKHQYYALTFNKGRVSTTDFVTINSV